mgnify:CR=1 FL=1
MLLDYLASFQHATMSYYLVLNMLLQVNSIELNILIFFCCFLAGAAQWLVVMAVLYITGALLYAGKFERKILLYLISN